MSQFLNNTDDYSAEHSPGIDFDDAIKLPAGGSTCDIYRTRWQRRDVFVKRLKEEYRTKPLYLDALDKEFDIGVSLKHPSLPEYREFHRDYIVIDYIDGLTLSDMIKRRDPWLSKEKRIIRLLTELVDVVEYLHRHNVVHCDIKPDNIMITANNRNLVLIDFDKCYTDALNDTSGHPSKYGLTADEPGKAAIDFRGIGMVVENLKASVPGFKFSEYRKFVKACHDPNVNCEDLRDILARPASGISSYKLVSIIVAGLIILGLLIGMVSYLIERNDKRMATSAPESAKEIDRDTIITPVSGEIVSEPTAITQKEIHNDAQAKAAILDQRIQPSFNVLLTGLDRLQALKADSTMSGQQLLDSIRRHSDLADEYIAEAFEILNETFPGLTDREAWRIMSYSKAYTGYTRRATPELNEYGQAMELRFKAEGHTPQ